MFLNLPALRRCSNCCLVNDLTDIVSASLHSWYRNVLRLFGVRIADVKVNSPLLCR